MLWQGEYEDVINLAERTYNESLGLGKSILTIDPLLLIVDASLWIFHMDVAFDALMQAEKLINAFSEEMPDECLKREAYMSYLKGGYYLKRKNPDLDRAHEYTERSLELRKKVGNELDIGFSLLGFGVRLIYIKSEIERGLEYINQALELGKKYDNVNENVNLYTYSQLVPIEIYSSGSSLEYNDTKWINSTTTLIIPIENKPERVVLNYSDNIPVQFSDYGLDYLEIILEKEQQILGYNFVMILVFSLIGIIIIIKKTQMSRR